jgi:uncharacterized membrane protein
MTADSILEQTTTAPLPDLVAQNIETVRRLRLEAERKNGSSHQPIERVFEALARPQSIYAIIGLILAWVALNLVLLWSDLHPLDAPPFYYMDSVLAVLSLLTTVVILIVQARQGKLAEARSELELQVNLLAEQKIAKLIELVEGMRRDSPFMQNLDDAEVEAMKRSSDPEKILQALEGVVADTEEAKEEAREPETLKS